MATDNRTLSARLDAYIANLASINSQTANIVSILEAKNVHENVPYDVTALAGMVKLQEHIIDDLTKVVNGETLEPFAIEIL